MPTYEYKCKSCGHRFEFFQSMSDAPKRKCPDCGKNALERLIGTGAAVIFKGSGFYQTDYRSESYKKGAEAEKPAQTKSESKTESKTETKAETPATKTESPKESKPPKSDAKEKKGKSKP